MGSPALLELPRGCDYWKDRRMNDLVEGTVSHEHKFDGCIYGLKSQFQDTPKPIKKPWKIVTWGLSFPKLRRKCDRRHDHAECARRETRITQIYTKWIAKIIMKGINEHVIKNSPFVNVKVRKQWKIIAPDEDWLSEVSRDSENVRSHPIKLVTATACVVRGPDAIDLSFERSRSSVRALSSALVLFEINIAFDKIFVVFGISVASAFWIQRQFVVPRPTIRTLVGVDWGTVTLLFVDTKRATENHND